MSEQHSTDRRQLYRMRLAHGDELTVVFEGAAYKVVEISERGFRIAGSSVPNRSGRCRGTITWNSGRTSEIDGVIGRTDGDELVILNVRGISMSEIVEEQRRASRLKVLRLITED